MENYHLVTKAYEELTAAGVIKPTSNQSEVEEQKAALTRRAAYYLNQVSPSWGLLSKTSGNNVQGLSVDIVIHKSGYYADIATDRETSPGMRQAFPVDAGMQNDASLVARWVQPTAEMAGLNETPKPPVEEPPTEEPTDIHPLVEFLQEINSNLVSLKGEVAALRQSVDTLKIDVTNKVNALKGCVLGGIKFK